MGMGTDARIGASFLFPGVGYGGSCFPKDVKALIRMGQDAGVDFNVVEAVDETNDAQKSILVPRIEAHLGGLAGKTIAIWGLAFKPRTDDMREAPAISIIEKLLALRRRRAGLRPEGGGAGVPGVRRPGHDDRPRVRGA